MRKSTLVVDRRGEYRTFISQYDYSESIVSPISLTGVRQRRYFEYGYIEDALYLLLYF